jgi:hypothetical protein
VLRQIINFRAASDVRATSSARSRRAEQTTQLGLTTAWADGGKGRSLGTGARRAALARRRGPNVDSRIHGVGLNTGKLSFPNVSPNVSPNVTSGTMNYQYQKDGLCVCVYVNLQAYL